LYSHLQRPRKSSAIPPDQHQAIINLAAHRKFVAANLGLHLDVTLACGRNPAIAEYTGK
jgi:hypothetical protein